MRLEPGSEERQEIVDEEVEDLENAYMGSGHLAERFGMCLVVLLVNLVIGGSVGLLFAAMCSTHGTGAFCPVYVLFPCCAGLFHVSKLREPFEEILGQCLNTILMRPAISLILTGSVFNLYVVLSAGRCV